MTAAGLLAAPFIVQAATTVNSPTAACFQAGSQVTFDWSLDPAANHSYVALWQGADQPTYVTRPGQNLMPGLPSHYATGPVTWTAGNLTTNEPYQLYVESHTGGHSNINTALSTPFNIDASLPVAPSLTGGGVGDTVVNISWNVPADTGCEGVRGYRVYRNNALIATIAATSFQDSGRTPNTQYTYKVVAFDNFGASPDSNTLTMTTKQPGSVAGPMQQTTTTATSTQQAPEPGNPTPVAQVTTDPSKIDIPDTSNFKEAEVPDRLKQTVYANTEIKDKGGVNFYALAGATFIFVGGGVILLISRGHGL